MGYDTELFVGSTRDELARFLCPICHDVVQDVVETSCGHIFCLKCLEQHLLQVKHTCPLCNSRLTVSDVHASKFLNRQIMEFGTKCVNHKLGCTWIGRLGQLNVDSFDSHIRACDFGEEVCGLYGCKVKMQRKHIQAHRKEEQILHLNLKVDSLSAENKSLSSKVQILEVNESKRSEEIQLLHSSIQQLQSELHDVKDDDDQDMQLVPCVGNESYQDVEVSHRSNDVSDLEVRNFQYVIHQEAALYRELQKRSEQIRDHFRRKCSVVDLFVIIGKEHCDYCWTGGKYIHCKYNELHYVVYYATEALRRSDYERNGAPWILSLSQEANLPLMFQSDGVTQQELRVLRQVIYEQTANENDRFERTKKIRDKFHDYLDVAIIIAVTSREACDASWTGGKYIRYQYQDQFYRIYFTQYIGD